MSTREPHTQETREGSLADGLGLVMSRCRGSTVFGGAILLIGISRLFGRAL